MKPIAIIQDISKDQRKIYILILSLIAIILIIRRFEALFITVLLITLGAVSLIYQRYFRYAHYIGFELCTMSTVLISLAYGPLQGALAGGISIFLGFILSGHFKPSYFVSVLALPVIGLIAPMFDLPLPWLGLIMTIIYDAIILPLYIMMGSRMLSSAIFFATHVLLNIWIFSVIAPLFYAVM